MHSWIKMALITLGCAGWLLAAACHQGEVASPQEKDRPTSLGIVSWSSASQPSTPRVDPHRPATSQPVISRLNLVDASVTDVAILLQGEMGIRIGFEVSEPPERRSTSLHDVPLSEVAEKLAGLFPGYVARQASAGPTLMLKSSPLHEARGRYQILEPTRLAGALPIIGRQIAEHLGPDHRVIAGIMGSGTSPSPFQNVTVDVQGDAYDALDAIVAQTEDLNWRIRWSNDGRVWISVRAARVHAPARTDNLTVYNRDEEMRRRREAMAKETAARIQTAASRPAQAPASRDADEQITKAYNVGESADQLAEKLNEVVPSLFYGEDVIIRSSPDTKQIIVTGSNRVHAMLGSLLIRPHPTTPDQDHVVYLFALKNRRVEPWVQVIDGALDKPDDAVIPDTHTNCFVVYIAKKDFNRIAYLIAVLDRPRLSKPAEDRLAMTVRLKHARPADFIDVITRLYPTPARMPDYATPQEVLAGIVTASSLKGSEDTVLINAAPQLEPEIKALIPLLDTAKPADIELHKVFEPEHADVVEIASVLKQLSGDPSERWRVTVVTRTNSLIVQANIVCLENIAAIVQALDEPEAWRGDPKEFMREFMDKHKPGSASQPATRPARAPASGDADEQITKAYQVNGPADEIAKRLDNILPAISGGAEAPVIRSAPAAKQIVVTGSPGAHKVIEDLLPKIEAWPLTPKQPATSTGPTADLPPWGEEVEGLRCRLVPDRSTLKPGELPRMILYVRDQASRVLTSYFDTGGDSPWVSCELELDGRWHPVQLHGRDEPDGSKILVSLGNGPPRLGFPMRLWDTTDGKQLPGLAAGRHTIRAAFTVSVSAGTGIRPIRVLSNPVEIEILPSGDEATRPANQSGEGVGLGYRVRATSPRE